MDRSSLDWQAARPAAPARRIGNRRRVSAGARARAPKAAGGGGGSSSGGSRAVYCTLLLHPKCSSCAKTFGARSSKGGWPATRFSFCCASKHTGRLAKSHDDGCVALRLWRRLTGSGRCAREPGPERCRQAPAWRAPAPGPLLIHGCTASFPSQCCNSHIEIYSCLPA